MKFGVTPKELFLEISEKDILQPATNYFRAIELAVVLSHFSPFGTLLDVGCGNGTLTSILSKRWSKVTDYIGVDLDIEQIERARKTERYDQLYCTSANQIPLQDNSVHSVFSNSVVEHIPHLESVIEEMARILMPGGVFAITTSSEHWNTFLTGPSFLSRFYLKNDRDSYIAEYNRRTAIVSILDQNRWETVCNNVLLQDLTFHYYLNRDQFRTWEFWSNHTGGLAWSLAGKTATMHQIQHKSRLNRLPPQLIGLMNKIFYFGFSSQLSDPKGDKGACVLITGRKSG